jgi:enoyl-CoA hydratase/carnithine racemase
VKRLEDGIYALQLPTFLDEEVLAALESARAMTEMQVLVLTGGDTWFSKGASRESLLAPGGASALAPSYSALPRLLLELPVPVVAAMRGHAVGGGLVAGLWCDAFVMAEESLYGANFMALGFTPGMGATAVVPEIFGPELGREMLFGGALKKGRELWPRAVPKARVEEAAMELARDFAAAPRTALSLLKETLARPRLLQLELALADERDMHRVLFDDHRTRALIAERYAPGEPE